MRVCYIYLGHVGEKMSGVENKIASKFEVLKQQFSEASLVNISNSEHTIKGAILINYTLKKSLLWRQNLVVKSKFLAIKKFISEHKENYDLFMIRYTIANIHQCKLASRFPKKIVFEHNTNEIAEAQLVAESNRIRVPFKFRPSVINYYFKKVWFLSFIEKKIGPMTLAKAAGGMAVTNEIKNFEINRCKNYEVNTFSNGMQYQNHVQTDKEIGSVFHGLFLAGTYAEWHGIERIIESLLKSSKIHLIKIDFIGRIGDQLKQRYSTNENISFLEYMNLNELKANLNQYHFGLGTAAIHKKYLTEGSVLKLREYLSFGLPIVYGHHDPYITSKSSLKTFALEFPASDELMDFDQIYNWLSILYQQENLNKTIHNAANNTLTWKSTLEELPAFLTHLRATSIDTD